VQADKLVVSRELILGKERSRTCRLSLCSECKSSGAVPAALQIKSVVNATPSETLAGDSVSCGSLMSDISNEMLVRYANDQNIDALASNLQGAFGPLSLRLGLTKLKPDILRRNQ
jgi:hypothetical protein